VPVIKTPNATTHRVHTSAVVTLVTLEMDALVDRKVRAAMFCATAIETLDANTMKILDRIFASAVLDMTATVTGAQFQDHRSSLIATASQVFATPMLSASTTGPHNDSTVAAIEDGKEMDRDASVSTVAVTHLSVTSMPGARDEALSTFVIASMVTKATGSNALGPVCSRRTS
jgi:hypothetical protein